MKYSEERLENFLLQNKDIPPKNLLNNLKTTLQEFRKGSDLTDDISLIYLKRL